MEIDAWIIYNHQENEAIIDLEHCLTLNRFKQHILDLQGLSSKFMDSYIYSIYAHTCFMPVMND